jgi:hypothetical protein
MARFPLNEILIKARSRKKKQCPGRNLEIAEPRSSPYMPSAVLNSTGIHTGTAHLYVCHNQMHSLPFKLGHFNRPLQKDVCAVSTVDACNGHATLPISIRPLQKDVLLSRSRALLEPQMEGVAPCRVVARRRRGLIRYENPPTHGSA